jgi:predicted lipoprotein with Yx(FWY)xxD motif
VTISSVARRGLPIVIATVLGACGTTAAKSGPASTPSSTATPAATTASQPAPAARVAAVKPRVRTGPAAIAVRSAPGYGKLLVDGSGRTLYLFTADGRGGSACNGACAQAWPPLYGSDTSRLGRGIVAARVTVVRRRDGRRQLAYYGHPLYYYVGDRQPGQINCQDAEEYGGHWWLVKPDGSQNRSTP